MNGLTQNIVNNSSFEEVIGCPSASDINYVPPWFANSPSSPDVYNICNWNIPNALPGYQWPNSGVCFVGIWFGTVGTEYFTGNYPTPGGNKVANQSFINFMQGKNVRAY